MATCGRLTHTALPLWHFGDTAMKYYFLMFLFAAIYEVSATKTAARKGGYFALGDPLSLAGIVPVSVMNSLFIAAASAPVSHVYNQN